MEDRHQRAVSLRTPVGAVCWLLTVVWFVLQPVIAAGWPRPYSYRADPVSDLGATRCGSAPGQGGLAARYVCSPWHLGWDAVFVGCGVLVIVGALLLRSAGWPRRSSVTAATVLLVISGAGLITVGVFPDDADSVVHAGAAAVHIPAQGVALLLLGIGFARGRHRLAVWTLVCAVITLVGTVIFFSPLSGAIGYGLAERLALAPFMAWLVITGLLSLRTASSPERRASRNPR